MIEEKEIVSDDQGAREKIIEAAMLLFATEGLHGVSTRDIAQKSGLNISLISYYFGGKEGLYKTVIQEFASRVFSRVEAVVNEFEHEEVSAKSIQKAIHALVDNFITMRIEHPHMAKILTREKLGGMAYSREIHQATFHNVGEKVCSIIAKGQKAGVVNKKINPMFFLCCLTESIMGYFNLFDCQCDVNKRLYQMPQQREEFRNQISLLFLEGIFK
jgi:AcrR family transcriptional regulator